MHHRLLRAVPPRRLCGTSATSSSGEKSETSEPPAAPPNKEISKPVYDDKYVYSRSHPDGSRTIISKADNPVAPAAHWEGGVLDYSDDAMHPMRHNPFADLVADAKSGDWSGVDPTALALPGAHKKSMYAFERRMKHEVLPHGYTHRSPTDIPEDINEALVYHSARSRLPAFDPVRESLFDKYVMRRYREQGDLRRLEAESVWARHEYSQLLAEANLQSAASLRQVVIRDAVMQSPLKWLALKHIEETETFVLKGEDQKFDAILNFYIYYYTMLAALVISFFYWLDGGTLETLFIGAEGECLSISGDTRYHTLFGSYRAVGDMYQFQDKVGRHMRRMKGEYVPGNVNLTDDKEGRSQ